MIWLVQLVEAEALHVIEASQYWPHSVHEPVLAFQKCCTHPAKYTSFKILQKTRCKVCAWSVEIPSNERRY
jgi:hypothetical protein